VNHVDSGKHRSIVKAAERISVEPLPGHAGAQPALAYTANPFSFENDTMLARDSPKYK
jgi:hypothetical protein